MPIITRFSSLSDIEFERELEHHLQGGQLVLGAEMTSELMERVRVWVDVEERHRKVMRIAEQQICRLEDEIDGLYIVNITVSWVKYNRTYSVSLDTKLNGTGELIEMQSN